MCVLTLLLDKIDNTGTVRSVRGRPLPICRKTVPVLSIFYQCFQSTKTLVFVRKHLSNRFAPYFLFSGKDLIKYLYSVLIPIIDV